MLRYVLTAQKETGVHKAVKSTVTRKPQNEYACLFSIVRNATFS
jgi:hypothetical protein